jgi:hypothetical protein
LVGCLREDNDSWFMVREPFIAVVRRACLAIVGDNIVA